MKVNTENNLAFTFSLRLQNKLDSFHSHFHVSSVFPKLIVAQISLVND